MEIVKHGPAMEHRIETEKVLTSLGTDTVQYFHHFHHDVDPPVVEHCGGPHRHKFPELDYTIQHCSCNKHLIDNRLAVGHDENLRALVWKFTERCPSGGGYHLESGLVAFPYTPDICIQCGKTPAEFRCPNCKKVWLCGNHCWRKYWRREHEDVCRVAKKPSLPPGWDLVTTQYMYHGSPTLITDKLRPSKGYFRGMKDVMGLFGTPSLIYALYFGTDCKSGWIFKNNIVRHEHHIYEFLPNGRDCMRVPGYVYRLPREPFKIEPRTDVETGLEYSTPESVTALDSLFVPDVYDLVMALSPWTIVPFEAAVKPGRVERGDVLLYMASDIGIFTHHDEAYRVIGDFILYEDPARAVDGRYLCKCTLVFIDDKPMVDGVVKSDWCMVLETFDRENQLKKI
jgi:hypothetical protein